MGMSNSKLLTVTLLLGLGFGGLLFFSIDNFAVYFFTPDEAFAQAANLSDRKIRIGGLVKAGSVTSRDLETQFTLTDLRSVDIAVSYHGVPPDMFKENSGVIVEGSISADGSQFTARELLVKHSQEYKAPSAEHPKIDPKLIEKSLLKGASRT